jgi:hypothetical protein
VFPGDPMGRYAVIELPVEITGVAHDTARHDNR